jgi:hypothetical protein
MRLQVMALSDPGSPGRTNEDVAGSTDRSAWVLDGATGLGGDDLIAGEPAAAWLARAYDQRLRAAGARKLAAPSALFARVITEVAAEFKAIRARAPRHRYEQPSAGMIFVQLRKAGRLEWASLGDCRAILRGCSGRMRVTPGSATLRRLDRKAITELAARRRAAEAHGMDPPYADLLAAVRPTLRKHRGQLNRPGADGYWVLAGHTAAVGHLACGELPVPDRGDPVRGLLVSDGFYRLVDTFRRYGDAELLDAALRPGGLVALRDELRALEQADPECRNPLRLKPRDDATALLFQVTGVPTG